MHAFALSPLHHVSVQQFSVCRRAMSCLYHVLLAGACFCVVTYGKFDRVKDARMTRCRQESASCHTDVCKHQSDMFHIVHHIE